MKVLVEITYRQETEPTEFESVEPRERAVYVWATNRGIIEKDAPYIVHERISEFDQEPPASGFTEIWIASLDQGDPPVAHVDDSWTETFKPLQYQGVSLEWHPQEHLIRLSWQQSLQSLKKGPLTVAYQQLQRLGLEYPSLPKLLLE